MNVLLFPHLYLFVMGCCSGFISSTPPGPINLWIVEKTLANRFHSTFPFLSGVIAADIFLAIFAFVGYERWLESFTDHTGLAGIGSIAMLLFGISMLLQGKQRRPALQVAQPSVLPQQFIGEMLLGITFCAANPGFLVYWLAVADLSQKTFHVTLDATSTLRTVCLLLCFACGILLGDYLWFAFLRQLTSKSRSIVSTLVLSRIRLGAGLVLIGYSLKTLLRL